MMEITKVKKTTYKILNVVVDLITFDEHYVKMRQKYNYQGFSCFICNKRFELNEKIGLIFTDKGNKAVCRKCAEEVKGELTHEAVGKS
jgi:hypothetical protein